jgi:hypothetical protein
MINNAEGNTLGNSIIVGPGTLPGKYRCRRTPKNLSWPGSRGTWTLRLFLRAQRFHVVFPASHMRAIAGAIFEMRQPAYLGALPNRRVVFPTLRQADGTM